MSRRPFLLIAALLIAGCTQLKFPEDPDTSPLYFTTPRDAVAKIRFMLKRQQWPTLARYYDLTGTDVDREQLVSGRYFYNERPPMDADPMGLWRYRHPFHPAYEYLNVAETDAYRVVKVTVVLEIDQGGGPPKRSLQSFRLRLTGHGYQILPKS